MKKLANIIYNRLTSLPDTIVVVGMMMLISLLISCLLFVIFDLICT